MIKIIEDELVKKRVSSTILKDLPEWFGIEEATADYIAKSMKMPFLAYEYEGEKIGFISLKETSKDTCEIFVMGILKKYHKKGIGKKLYYEFEKLAKTQGFSYIQVKTVQMGHYKEYDATNNFYISVGFKELECFSDMWDPLNPCQIYIKYIR